MFSLILLISISGICLALLSTISTNILSKSSPPKLVSPEVPNTSKLVDLSFSFLSKDNIDTSNVPPPKSNTNIFLLYKKIFLQVNIS